MFPHSYWTPRYWTGKYWPPAGLVVRLPDLVPLQSILTPGSLIAAISLTDSLMAILTPEGVVGARLTQEEAAWLAQEQPPFATLVQEDLSAVLGSDAFAIQMPVLYVGADIVAEMLKSKIEDEAIISVVAPTNDSVTLKA